MTTQPPKLCRHCQQPASQALTVSEIFYVSDATGEILFQVAICTDCFKKQLGIHPVQLLFRCGV